MPARFIRVAEQDRGPIENDGVHHMALEGDTLLVAVLTHAGRLRQSEFGDGSGACRAYVDPGNTLNQLPQLRRPRPSIATVRIIRVWSGIESYLPDDLPIMGPSEKVPGLFYAFGLCGAGFQVGPAVGDVMAELIDTGRSSLSLDDYGIGHFAQQKAA